MVDHVNLRNSITCILGGTLLDGTGCEPLPDAAVLIENKQIKEIGLRRNIKIPRDSRVIEAEGKTILPGLIDCHVHLIYSGYRTLQEIDQEPLEMATLKAMHNADVVLRAGFTTVRDVGTRGRVSLAVRDAINYGLIPGPRILSSGQIISTTGGLADPHPAWIPCHVALGHIADGPWEMARAIRQQVKAGVDLIKLAGSAAEASPYTATWMSGITPEELKIAVDVAHDYSRRVAFHGQALESTKAALRASIDTLEHGTRLDEEAVSLLKQKDITLVPTLSTLYSVLEFPDPQKLLPKQVQEMAVNNDLWLKSLKLAYEAGVRIAVGGDIGNRKPQGTNAVELQYLVQSGISPMDAIVAATKHGAQALGLDFVGTLEPGKIADLLIVNGDPLADITILQDRQRLVMVMQEGKLVDIKS
jgi:imidazolonepropionase-like amidohydrolase